MKLKTSLAASAKTASIVCAPFALPSNDVKRSGGQFPSYWIIRRRAGARPGFLSLHLLLFFFCLFFFFRFYDLNSNNHRGYGYSEKSEQFQNRELISIPLMQPMVLQCHIWLKDRGFMCCFSEHNKSRIFIFILFKELNWRGRSKPRCPQKSGQNILVLRSVILKAGVKKNSSVYWGKAVFGETFQAEISANRTEEKGGKRGDFYWLTEIGQPQTKFSRLLFLFFPRESSRATRRGAWAAARIKRFNAIDSF